MKQLVQANLRTHGRRYLATGLAVFIAVVFVVAVLMLSGALGTSIGNSFADQYRGSSAVVEDREGTGTDVVEEVSGTPGVELVVPALNTYAQFGGSGQQFGSIAGVLPEPLFRPHLSQGELPTGPDQIALDAKLASALDLAVGDRLTIHPYTEGHSLDVEVSGIFGEGNSPASVNSDALMTPAGIHQLSGDSYASTYLVVGSNGFTQEQVAAAVRAALSSDELTVQTEQEAVEAALAEANLASSGMSLALMVFPAIAIVVAIIVVSTTFQVLVRQRQRELGLLRCVGATGRQVRRLILVESLLVGVVASALGVAVGVIASALAISGFGLLPSLTQAFGSASWLTLFLVFVLGVLVTVLAGLRPALQVGRVAPLTAFTAAAVEPVERTRGWWVRLSLGAFVSIAAGTVMVITANWHSTAGLGLAIVSGMATLVGLTLFLSAVFPRLVAWVGAPMRSTLGQLATGNTQRSPGRTAATGVSIFIGVSLIVMMLVGASSLSLTMNRELDSRLATDLVITSSNGELTEADVQAVTDLPGVAKTAPEWGLADASVDGEPVTLYGVDASDRVARTQGEPLGDDRVLVPETSGLESGQTVNVCVAQNCADLEALVDTSWLAQDGRAGVSQATLDRLGAGVTPQMQAILAQLDSTSDYRTVSNAIGKLDQSWSLGGAASTRAQFDEMITMILTVVVALLGVSVVVSLVGVSNTLALSVAERTRENGLLRALGMTRRQVSRMLTWEAVLISFTAALVGVGAGILFGWIGTVAVMMEVAAAQLDIPWLQIVLVLALAIVAAALSSWWPGRKAGRTSPVEALAVD